MATPRRAPRGGSVREAVGQAESCPPKMAQCWQSKLLGGSSEHVLRAVTCTLLATCLNKRSGLVGFI